MAGEVAWFVDGAYVFKCRQPQQPDQLDYVKLRQRVEARFCGPGETIHEAFYFTADPDPPTAQRNKFHAFLSVAPPGGPGLRTKIYWLTKRVLHWPPAMGGQQVTHPISGAPYEQTMQKGVDVGLAFTLMQSFARARWKKLVLAAGDSDFEEVVRHLHDNEGVEVFGVGTKGSMSNDLQLLMSDFLWLDAEAAFLKK